jgi:uncharacterized membrane protein YfcA
MALFSIAPAILKPTALFLNILVSAIAAFCFFRAGHFSWRLFWPFAATSVPCSFLGGYLNLPPHLYKPLVGMVLLFSAWRLLSHTDADDRTVRAPALPAALVAGALLGLLSGLTGVGGGIFLSPLLLLLGWARAREVSAVAALFILVNSLAGLLGHYSSVQALPNLAPLLAGMALAGGLIGSLFGSRHLPAAAIVRTLSAVLVVAGVKLILL